MRYHETQMHEIWTHIYIINHETLPRCVLVTIIIIHINHTLKHMDAYAILLKIMINPQHGDSHAAIRMCYAIDACRHHHGGSSCVQATWHMPTHGV